MTLGVFSFPESVTSPPDSVIRKLRITASDNQNYNTLHHQLPAIIAVGYKVNSERAVQFRKWATGIVEQFTIKAYVMDDERIKAGGSVLTDRCFEEQLQRIREIRLSARKFYQKITDIYATALDYDVTAQAAQRFMPRCGTSCTGRSTDRRRPSWWSAGPMRRSPTWG